MLKTLVGEHFSYIIILLSDYFHQLYHHNRPFLPTILSYWIIPTNYIIILNHSCQLYYHFQSDHSCQLCYYVIILPTILSYQIRPFLPTILSYWVIPTNYIIISNQIIPTNYLIIPGHSYQVYYYIRLFLPNILSDQIILHSCSWWKRLFTIKHECGTGVLEYN